MSYVLKVTNLHKSFQKHILSPKIPCLKNVSFALPKACSVGFLGANASGKTTTFKCLLELIKKDQGEILFFEKTLSLKSRLRIGFLPERPQFYEDLTALEQLQFYASINSKISLDTKLRIQNGLKKLDLYKWKDHKLKIFSKGMLQKVGILQALMHKPDMLILDEPFSGLDPESRFLVSELLKDTIDQGCTILLSSHLLQDIERLCDRVLIIKDGSIMFDGDFSQISKSQHTKQNMTYFLNNKKYNITFLNQEDCQKTLRKLVSQGAKISSIENYEASLEEKYKKFINMKDTK